jgi:predicted metal-dependent hydrolase
MIIDGIDIQVEYKPIKNTHLAVYPPDGRVHVSAPDYLTEDDVRSYVVSKWDWIIRQRTVIAETPRQTERQFVSGESHYLFGTRYYLKVEEISSGLSEIVIQGTKMMMRLNKVSNRRALMQDFYRTKLKNFLEEVISKWMVQLSISNFTWQIKMMKTQWGSCTKKSRILLFNLELARVPKECIEYVVVHELTHLTVPSHNRVFQTLMTERLPRWREIRKQLGDFIASEWNG